MFLRWFREVHEHPLPGLPIAVVCHVCRCGELCMRKIDIHIQGVQVSQPEEFKTRITTVTNFPRRFSVNL